MAFESLSERFQAAFKKLRGKGKLSEEDVSEALKEMRRASWKRMSILLLPRTSSSVSGRKPSAKRCLAV